MNKNEKKLSLSELTFEDIESSYVAQEIFPKNKSKIIESTNRLKNNIGIFNEKYSYKIEEVYGILSDGKNPIVFSLINWGNYLNKRYDLRHWNYDMSIPHKGLTFTESELKIILQHPFEESISIKNDKIVAVYSQGKSKATIYRNVAILNLLKSHRDVWKKEINLVDWGKGIKFDFRQWDERYKRCGKGICLSLQEYQLLYKLLSEIFK